MFQPTIIISNSHPSALISFVVAVQPWKLSLFQGGAAPFLGEMKSSWPSQRLEPHQSAGMHQMGVYTCSTHGDRERERETLYKFGPHIIIMMWLTEEENRTLDSAPKCKNSSFGVCYHCQQVAQNVIIPSGTNLISRVKSRQTAATLPIIVRWCSLCAELFFLVHCDSDYATPHLRFPNRLLVATANARKAERGIERTCKRYNLVAFH